MSALPLIGNQARAVNPDDTVWLSASAGTGKTHVLSARVLRLLLQQSVRPDQILCLTFTKAGAAEMAERINRDLARWVRLKDTELALELKAIGADYGPEVLAHARTLFAKVLDCPGGGLRIDTIHAFAQWLLAAFPNEAGLVPGTRPMEDRERGLLAHRVLGDLLVTAEASSDQTLLAAAEMLALRMAPDAVQAFLLRCAAARGLWFGTQAWQPPLKGHVHRVLGLADGASADDLAALCDDARFDTMALRRCQQTMANWDSKTGRDADAAIGEWLSSTNAVRLAGLDALYALLFTKDGAPRQLTNILKRDPDYVAPIGQVAESMSRIRDMRSLLALAQWLTPALELGWAFAVAWEQAKAREGLIDFDDQIARAAELLGNSAMAGWIRFKLDRQFDHILVDEAQDTNAAQWQIIDALTDDFFSGESASGGKPRSLFVVGDYKQAIFGFQGTSPENFEAARERVMARMAGLAANADALRGGPVVRPLARLGLGQSFRSSAQMLEFVDAGIAQIGHERFGLSAPPDKHLGLPLPGHVCLWQPVGGKIELADESEEEDSFLSQSDRQLADKIAQQVAEWLDETKPGIGLAKRDYAKAKAGDIMVLVRSRKELAGLIVARLNAAKVPVAGIDRLRLGAPLAVKDLMAALRFAAQPLDSLSLANLLTSPLIGWTQEQLLEHGYREKGVPLWSHLRRSSHGDVALAMEQLGGLLARADFAPVQALLHWLLVGPWQGRRRLVARLGIEANDPIDELLNAAQLFASTNTASIVGFIHWFDAGDGEIKREAGRNDGLVRVMTVHGAKGLQAPIVILADATSNPEKAKSKDLTLPDPYDAAKHMPLPSLTTADRAGPIADADRAARKAELQEHWRLLYVAMTRAEEALFITGALGRSETEPAAQSWYAELAQVAGLSLPLPDDRWGARQEYGAPLSPSKAGVAVVELPLPPALPGWLSRAVGPEPRPPRPLAPSALAEDFAADPPAAVVGDRAAQSWAARRGTLIHALLERLPGVAVADRAVVADRWLARQAGDCDAALRTDIADAALRVLADPRWADIFAPDALAEVPITAVVDGRVIAGTIDRLLISPGRIGLIDFKTSRRPPAGIADVPPAILRQMAAYAVALAVIYPGRRVDAALLYTQTPVLIEIPAEVLAAHKPRA